MTETRYPAERITRIEAAMRQLRTGLELWFAHGDDVSIHTLAGSAYQVLHDLNRKNKGPPLLFDNPIIKEGHKREVVSVMKKDMNFFKHADLRKGKVDETTEFHPITSELFFVGALCGAQLLQQPLGMIELAFLRWCQYNRPEWQNRTDGDEFLSRLSTSQLQSIRSVGRSDFLKALIDGGLAKHLGVS